jgi:serine/threonine protein kinase
VPSRDQTGCCAALPRRSILCGLPPNKSLTASASSDARSRFERECRILSQFDHPHIARLLQHGIISSEIPFLVIEYVEGQPLPDYAQANGLDLKSRLTLFLKVCLAVAVSHRLGVVHRDLKPANILVTPNGDPKLLDFGIAKLAGDSTERLTATGWRPMTPVTSASDVYSLGVILKELTAHFSDGRLSRIIKMATAERAQERYASAAHLADDVTAYLFRQASARGAASPYIYNVLTSRLGAYAVCDGLCLSPG